MHIIICREIMQSGIIPFTEYEEEIAFDVDDPDFKQVGCSPSPTSHRSQAQQKSCSVEARGKLFLFRLFRYLCGFSSTPAVEWWQLWNSGDQPCRVCCPKWSASFNHRRTPIASQLMFHVRVALFGFIWL